MKVNVFEVDMRSDMVLALVFLVFLVFVVDVFIRQKEGRTEGSAQVCHVLKSNLRSWPVAVWQCFPLINSGKGH